MAVVSVAFPRNTAGQGGRHTEAPASSHPAAQVPFRLGKIPVKRMGLPVAESPPRRPELGSAGDSRAPPAVPPAHWIVVAEAAESAGGQRAAERRGRRPALLSGASHGVASPRPALQHRRGRPWRRDFDPNWCSVPAPDLGAASTTNGSVASLRNEAALRSSSICPAGRRRYFISVVTALPASRPR